MSDDLKRDLQLASATKDIAISPDEVAPKATKELALKPKRAPDGNKVIRSEKPTLKASALPVQAAEIKADIPDVQVMAAAPAPSETPAADAPPLARPSPVPVSYPGASPIPAGGNGGGVLAGIFGAVIRGGMVGDDDHCDPRSTPRRPNGGPGGVFGNTGGYRMPNRPNSGPIGMGGGRVIPIAGRSRM